jgi:hypothetical protein
VLVVSSRWSAWPGWRVCPCLLLCGHSASRNHGESRVKNVVSRKARRCREPWVHRRLDERSARSSMLAEVKGIKGLETSLSISCRDTTIGGSAFLSCYWFSGGHCDGGFSVSPFVPALSQSFGVSPVLGLMRQDNFFRCSSSILGCRHCRISSRISTVSRSCRTRQR